MVVGYIGLVGSMECLGYRAYVRAMEKNMGATIQVIYGY